MDFKTHSFKDEVFKVGTWNGFKITPKMLKDLKANFYRLGDVLKVPLKLGHNEKSNVNMIDDGQPALGWIEEVSLDNEENPTTLFANYTDMPTIVFQAIKNKLYRTRSIEMDFTAVYKGAVFENVLTAVALLGHTLPAVNELKDLKHYMEGDFSKDTDFSMYDVALSRDTSITADKHCCFSININNEVEIMTEAEILALQKKAADAELALATANATNVTLTSENAQFSADKTAREAADKQTAITTKRDEVKAVFETAVKAEVITPAKRETFAKLLGVDDDEKVINIDIEDVKTLIGGDAAMFSKKDTSSANTDTDDDDTSGLSPSEQLTQKTFEYMEKHGKEDFESASFAVMRANPKLSKENMLSNEEV